MISMDYDQANDSSQVKLGKIYSSGLLFKLFFLEMC